MTRARLLALTICLGASLAGTAWSATGDSGPTVSDVPAIEKKLAQIGIHVRRGDALFRTPSSSSEPTLHCAPPGVSCLGATADFVIARPYGASAPARGDLVAFRTPPKATIACGTGGVYLKRLIGLPGDTWAERNGTVYIDGKPLVEAYIKPAYRDDSTYTPEKIPAGHYFMMGDNRRGSCDSRKWGTVPRHNLIGKLIAIYWPLNRVRRL